MDATDLPPLPDTAFWRAYQGRFQGVLTWEGFDALWEVLEKSGGQWHVWDLDAGAPPDSPAPLAPALAQARAMYEEVRGRSYCGTVYVDDPAAPAFVKAFDPYRMGATCGSSGERIFPRFVFSRLRPEPLPTAGSAPPPSLWARILGRGQGRPRAGKG